MPTLSSPRTLADADGSLLVAVATYNERENMPPLVERIFAAVPHARLLVVDDNSPDGTGDWCDEYAQSDPRLTCLHRGGKQGLGSATVAMFRYAIDHNFEFLMNLDADLSHPPEKIPQFLDKLTGQESEEGTDVVVGSRYAPGGGIEGWPFRRHVLSRGVNWFARFALRLPVSDCSGAYRGYRVEVLRRLDLQAIRAGGYAVYEEVLWLLKRAGARFDEVPITFTDRTAGSSKASVAEALRAIGTLGMLGIRAWSRAPRGR